MIDFPNSPPPQSGDTYTAPNGQFYVFDGQKWIGSTGGGVAGEKGDKGDPGPIAYQQGDPFSFSTLTHYNANDVVTYGGDFWILSDYDNYIQSYTPDTYIGWTPFNLLLEGPQGPKGDTGDTGPKGDTGETGAPFDYSMFTEEQLLALKGDKGDTGDTGPKGDTGDPGAAGAKGDTGDAGPKGDTGDTGAKGDKGDTGDTGPKGDKGDTGDTGPTGPAGTSVNIIGSVPDANVGPAFDPQVTLSAAFPSAVTGNGVIDEFSGHLWVYDGIGWVDVGNITGPQGATGATGATGDPGADGASAYEVAVANGFSGDEATWLASLVGATGATGAKGDTGDPGATGATGPAGPGVPTGGTTGQVLAKIDETNYNTEWVTPSGGGGSGTVTSIATSGDVNGITLTGGTITTSGTITLGGTLGSIANSQLSNSTISGVALGGTLHSLTISSPLSGTSYNGSSDTTIALATGYGDTQNPYASKTANYVLAAPNGTAGAPTFRAIVAADIPTLNQNTTGSAGSVANALTIGTGLGGTSYNGSTAVTITNTDTGSAQNIFKTVAVSGQTSVTAASNTATLTLVAGTGIALTTDNTAKSVTITANGGSPTFTNVTVTGQIIEPFQTYSTAITGSPTITFNCTGGNIWLVNPTGGPGSAWTAAFTNVQITTNQATNLTMIVVEGATPFIPSAVSVNGTSVTVTWQGGTPPTPTASKTEAIGYSVLETAASTYTVLGQMVTFG